MRRITVSGYLGRDPETRQAGSHEVTEFSIGVSYKIKGDDRTDWYRAKAWGARGKAVAGFLRKGSFVIATGDLSPGIYKGNDGNARLGLDIDNADIDLGPKTTESGGGTRRSDIPF